MDTIHTITTFQKPRFFVVDFYCGAGGTTRGMLDAGAYVIAGIDNSPDCKKTYESNNCNRHIDQRGPCYLQLDMFPKSEEYPDGQQVEVIARLDELIGARRVIAPEIPLMFAICAPCQSFTKFSQPNITADKQLSRDRDQTLLNQVLPMIRKFRPEIVLSENVAGARNGKFQETWEDFWGDLQNNLGYSVGAKVVNTCRFGIAQSRRRLIGLAVKVKDASSQRLDYLIPDENKRVQSKNVEDIIGNLPSLQAGEAHKRLKNHRCRNLSDLNKRRLQAVEPGQSNRGIGKTLALECHIKMDRSGQPGFKDTYTRMKANAPSPTITTRFISVSNGRFGHYDDSQARGLSILEGALLQSFEKKYVFHVESMDTAAKMIGNAVPPKLAKFMSTTGLRIWHRAQGEA